MLGCGPFMEPVTPSSFVSPRTKTRTKTYHQLMNPTAVVQSPRKHLGGGAGTTASHPLSSIPTVVRKIPRILLGLDMLVPFFRRSCNVAGNHYWNESEGKYVQIIQPDEQIGKNHISEQLARTLQKDDVDTFMRMVMKDSSVITRTDELGETPLLLSVLHQREKITKFLLENHPHTARQTVSSGPHVGMNALHVAILQQRESLAEFILTHCPSLLSVTTTTPRASYLNGLTYYGDSPLFFAAATNQFSLVDMLLQRVSDEEVGCQLARTDQHGNTVFHVCVVQGRKKMYNHLENVWLQHTPCHERGKRPDSWLNKDLLSPFTLAAYIGQKDMFNFILEKRQILEWQSGATRLHMQPLDELDFIEGDGDEDMLPVLVGSPSTHTDSPTAARVSGGNCMQRTGMVANSGSSVVSTSTLGSGARGRGRGRGRTAEADQRYMRRGSIDSTNANLDSYSDFETCIRKSAVHLIMENEHLDLLTNKWVYAVLRLKWETYAESLFFERFIVFSIYMFLFMTFLFHPRTAYEDLQPFYLVLVELLVCAGSLWKLSSEVLEMWRQGIYYYFTVPGSMFLENVTSLVHSGCVVTHMYIRLLLICGQCEAHISNALLSLAALSGWCYTLFFFLGLRLTGPFVVMIFKMLFSDVLRFGVIFMAFLAGFSSAFSVLFGEPSSASWCEHLKTCFLTMLGSIDDYSHYWQSDFPLLSGLLYTIYLVIVTVLLLNLLIAMMGDTYAQVKTDAHKQWVLEWCRIISSMEKERPNFITQYWIERNGKRFVQLLEIDPNFYDVEDSNGNELVPSDKGSARQNGGVAVGPFSFRSPRTPGTDGSPPHFLDVTPAQSPLNVSPAASSFFDDEPPPVPVLRKLSPQNSSHKLSQLKAAFEHTSYVSNFNNSYNYSNYDIGLNNNSTSSNRHITPSDFSTVPIIKTTPSSPTQENGTGFLSTLDPKSGGSADTISSDIPLSPITPGVACELDSPETPRSLKAPPSNPPSPRDALHCNIMTDFNTITPPTTTNHTLVDDAGGSSPTSIIPSYRKLYREDSQGSSTLTSPVTNIRIKRKTTISSPLSPVSHHSSASDASDDDKHKKDNHSRCYSNTTSSPKDPNKLDNDRKKVSTSADSVVVQPPIPHKKDTAESAVCEQPQTLPNASSAPTQQQQNKKKEKAIPPPLSLSYRSEKPEFSIAIKAASNDNLLQEQQNNLSFEEKVAMARPVSSSAARVQPPTPTRRYSNIKLKCPTPCSEVEKEGNSSESRPPSPLTDAEYRDFEELLPCTTTTEPSMNSCNNKTGSLDIGNHHCSTNYPTPGSSTSSSSGSVTSGTNITHAFRRHTSLRSHDANSDISTPTTTTTTPTTTTQHANKSEFEEAFALVQADNRKLQQRIQDAMDAQKKSEEQLRLFAQENEHLHIQLSQQQQQPREGGIAPGHQQGVPSPPSPSNTYSPRSQNNVVQRSNSNGSLASLYTTSTPRGDITCFSTTTPTRNLHHQDGAIHPVIVHYSTPAIITRHGRTPPVEGLSTPSTPSTSCILRRTSLETLGSSATSTRTDSSHSSSTPRIQQQVLHHVLADTVGGGVRMAPVTSALSRFPISLGQRHTTNSPASSRLGFKNDNLQEAF